MSQGVASMGLRAIRSKQVSSLGLGLTGLGIWCRI